MIYNEEYQRIEKFLTDYIQASVKEKLDFHFYITIRDTLPEPYREYPPVIKVGLRSNRVNKEGQKFIKQWFKDTFDLDKPVLEREYGSTSREILYEMSYKPSKDLYDKIKILSKI